jgi:hypothetical protein
MAMDEMRPVTRPKLGEMTADGPSGCQIAVEALEESGAEADGRGAVKPIREPPEIAVEPGIAVDWLRGQPRRARNLRA